jgi:hypothetical protein
MSILVFAGVFLIGNPVDVLISPDATQEIRQQVIAQYGLDLQIWQQYLHFMASLLQGDFGRSFVYNMPVSELVASRFPATMELATIAVLLASVIGIPLGVYAGYRPDGWPSKIIMAVSILGFSVPTFWIGLMMIVVFAVEIDAVFRILRLIDPLQSRPRKVFHPGCVRGAAVDFQHLGHGLRCAPPVVQLDARIAIAVQPFGDHSRRGRIAAMSIDHQDAPESGVIQAVEDVLYHRDIGADAQSDRAWKVGEPGGQSIGHDGKNRDAQRRGSVQRDLLGKDHIRSKTEARMLLDAPKGHDAAIIGLEAFLDLAPVHRIDVHCKLLPKTPSTILRWIISRYGSTLACDFKSGIATPIWPRWNATASTSL